ncbi:MAG TPA: hypothetical protein VNV44_08970 [Solirubrobacteraceae bacterium]|nr:hypothetical protein [Solirubrobacteraceae bacterium]
MTDEDPETPPGAQAVEDRLASALGVDQAAPTGAPGPRAWWRGLEPRAKRRLKIAGALSLAFVIVVSVLLARFLQTENVERDADLALIEAETRGDVQGMLAKLSGCAASPACVAQVRANARNPRLLRHGQVKILQLDSATAYALSGETGSSRVAWTVIGQLPVVQCVRVRRSGNPISGIKVSLLALSAPIPNEADC